MEHRSGNVSLTSAPNRERVAEVGGGGGGEGEGMERKQRMNQLYFTGVVEKTRGLFTSSPRP